MYQLECYRTGSNIKRKKPANDVQSVEDAASPSTSTSATSVRELPDSDKPVANKTKRFKEQSRLESKFIDYLERDMQQQQKSTQDVEPAKSKDLIDLHLATIGEMIRQRMRPEQQHDLLARLFNFVNQCIFQYETACRTGMTGPMMQELQSDLPNMPTIQPEPNMQQEDDYNTIEFQQL